MNSLNSKNICCVIISFNPDEGLFELINIIEKQVDKIIIVDNNSDIIGKDFLSTIAENSKVFSIKNTQNLGIAKALNQGIIEAGKMGYHWVITFDQDSTPYTNIIEIITEVYNLYPDKKKIGAIGANFSISPTESYYKVADNLKYVEKDYLITSGCLMSLDSFFQIGGFREDFFIDNVDLEYSLRLKKNNKVSLITKEWGMHHKAGDPHKKNLSVLSIVSSNHNSFRRYYMARNHVLLSREYLFTFPYFISKLNYFFFWSLLKIIFIEDDKKTKLINSLKGIKDGFLYSSKHKIYIK